MLALHEVYEGIAADIHDATGICAPVDPLDLATCLGFGVHECSLPGASIDEAAARIYVNRRARSTRKAAQIGHELGHHCLRRAGVADTENGARYLAGALLVPRRDFDRDLRETGWAWHELRRRHPNASAEVIAHRVCQLRDACAAVIDNGRLRARVVSPWLEEREDLRRVSRYERGLAQRALDAGELVADHDLVYAVPLVDGVWKRVVVIAEAEQLALRFG